MTGRVEERVIDDRTAHLVGDGLSRCSLGKHMHRVPVEISQLRDRRGAPGRLQLIQLGLEVIVEFKADGPIVATAAAPCDQREGTDQRHPKPHRVLFS